jgi:hypothetical protein
VIDPEKHLATYGRWDPATFFSRASERNRAVIVFAVRGVPGTPSDSARIGGVVRDIWDRVLVAIPGVVGHRLSWSELLFFAEMTPIGDVVRTISPLTVPPDADMQVRAAVQLAPGDPARRTFFCDELCSGLTKVEYRGAYPDAWCISDGIVVHVP